jgi:hypothetical protein
VEHVSSHKRYAYATTRLMVRQVPQEVADQRRRRIRAEVKDKRRAPSAAALAGADWTVIITNAPAELLNLTEALLLTRIRWQVELWTPSFKRLRRISTASTGSDGQYMVTGFDSRIQAN